MVAQQLMQEEGEDVDEVMKKEPIEEEYKEEVDFEEEDEEVLKGSTFVRVKKEEFAEEEEESGEDGGGGEDVPMLPLQKKRIKEEENRPIEFDPDNDGFRIDFQQAAALHKRLGLLQYVRKSLLGSQAAVIIESAQQLKAATEKEIQYGSSDLPANWDSELHDRYHIAKIFQGAVDRCR